MNDAVVDLADLQDLARRRPEPAIVLGFNPNSLGTVRSLSRAGIDVVVIGPRITSNRSRNAFMTRTRLAQVVQVDRTAWPACIPDALELCARRLKGKPVIIPSGDAEVAVLSKARERLQNTVAMVLPDEPLLTELVDKTEFDKLARACSIPAPTTLRELTPETLHAGIAGLTFPCIVKPSIRDATWDHRFGWHKVLECASADELRSNFTRAYETHRSLIVQEVVVGPDSQIVFSHTYVGRDGRELAMWTGRKLRQLPIHYGSATAAIAHRDPAVADYTRRLLANRNFVGYASVEFKIDTRDNSHRVLEATIARTCYHHALGLAMNVNIPLLWYNDALGKPVSPAAAEYNEAIWIDEYRDVAAAIAYSRAGELTLPEWLNSLRGARSYAHLAFDDVAPGASLGAQFAVGAFSYAGKRIASLLKGTSSESPDFGE